MHKLLEELRAIFKVAEEGLRSRDKEIETLKAQIAVLREALLAVEWAGDDVFYCPWCGEEGTYVFGELRGDHHPDCSRQRALRIEEETSCT